MLLSEVISDLENALLTCGDVEVTAQSSGCCSHFHELNKIDFEFCDDRVHLL